VEAAIVHTRAPAKRVTRYLEAVAEAQRVRELIDEGTRAGAFRRVHAAFVGEVVTAKMRRITSGEIAATTELSDAEAYAELADLVVAAIRR
jgi:predicted TIM-barrel enzyme